MFDRDFISDLFIKAVHPFLTVSRFDIIVLSYLKCTTNDYH